MSLTPWSTVQRGVDLFCDLGGGPRVEGDVGHGVEDVVDGAGDVRAC